VLLKVFQFGHRADAPADEMIKILTRIEINIVIGLSHRGRCTSGWPRHHRSRFEGAKAAE